MKRLLVLLLASIGAIVALPPAAQAAASVCSVFSDTRDPSLAQRETFPVAAKTVNGRRLVLHVSDPDGMGWASIDNGRQGDAVWLDRSWDGGATWDGLLGKASIPSTWTGTRTLMYNLSDPANHRRGMIRACGDAQAVVCTDWAYSKICEAACDGVSTGSGDSQPVGAATLSGRTIALHFDTNGLGWGTISGGNAGDEIWLDRSWDEGASWPGGSSLGRTSVAPGATTTATARFNTRDSIGRLSGGAVRACGRAVEGQNGSCTAWARPVTTRASAVADALLYSYNPDTAWWPSSWWNSAVAVNTVVDYQRRTGDTRYAWVVSRTYTVNKVAFPAGVKSTDEIEGHFISRATDDAEWWALAWVAAYDLTHDATYLNEAVIIANSVSKEWDTSVCGGGVWWNRDHTYKNAVTSGLYVKLTASLHNRIAGDTAWLNKATTAWNWFNSSGLVNSAGLVNDGLTSSCANNGETVWTYNQGLAFGGALEVYKATGNASILARARQLADAGTTSPVLVSNGILVESCDPANSCDDNQNQFKGIFMRYLAELNGATGGAYNAFVTRQADSVWNADRDSLNRCGERWNGATPNERDWRTQASALSAILAV